METFRTCIALAGALGKAVREFAETVKGCLCTQKRTEFHCPICEKGQREVFQPKLVIFRAEPSIDAPIRTCLPKIQACLDVFLDTYPMMAPMSDPGRPLGTNWGFGTKASI